MDRLKINRTNTIFLQILLFIVTIALPIIHFTNGVTDQFLFRDITYAHLFLDEPFLPLNSLAYDATFFYLPGPEINIIVISKILGLPPKSLQFLPILAVPLIFSLYALAEKIIPSKSSILKLLSVFITIYSVGRSSMNFFTVWPHAWAYVLYPIALALFYDVIRKKSVEKTLLLFLIFVAIHFCSYTAEYWVVSFSLIMSFLFMLVSSRFKPSKNNPRIRNPINLALISLVIMLMFNRAIYFSFLPIIRLDFGVSTNSLLTFIYKYFHISPKPSYYCTMPLQISYANLLFLISILIPIIVGGIKLIRKIIIGEYDSKLYPISWLCFVLATITVSVVDIFIYSMVGVIPFRYVLLTFPLVSVAFLWRFFHRRSLKYSLFVIILILSAIAPVLHYAYGTIRTSPLRYAEFESSCNWLLSHQFRQEPKIMGDQPTIEKYFLEARIVGKNFERHFLNDDAYRSIVNCSGENLKLDKVVDFVILNMKSQRIYTLGWIQYESFAKYTNEISNNLYLYKIYSDGVVWIAKPID